MSLRAANAAADFVPRPFTAPNLVTKPLIASAGGPDRFMRFGTVHDSTADTGHRSCRRFLVPFLSLCAVCGLRILTEVCGWLRLLHLTPTQRKAEYLFGFMWERKAW